MRYFVCQAMQTRHSAGFVTYEESDTERRENFCSKAPGLVLVWLVDGDTDKLFKIFLGGKEVDFPHVATMTTGAAL